MRAPRPTNPQGVRCAGRYPKGTCSATLRGRVGIDPYDKTEGARKFCRGRCPRPTEVPLGDIGPPSNERLPRIKRVDTPRVLAPLRFAGVWASTPTIRPRAFRKPCRGRRSRRPASSREDRLWCCRAACPRPTEVPLGDRPPSTYDSTPDRRRRGEGTPPYKVARGAACGSM